MVYRYWQSLLLQAILQSMSHNLRYIYYPNHPLPHCLMVTCPLDLSECEYVRDQFDEHLDDSYGQYYQDYCQAASRNAICAYFASRANAIRFLLSWRP